MKISEAIKSLTDLLVEHGDIRLVVSRSSFSEDSDDMKVDMLPIIAISNTSLDTGLGYCVASICHEDEDEYSDLAFKTYPANRLAIISLGDYIPLREHQYVVDVTMATVIGGNEPQLLPDGNIEVPSV